MLLLLPLLLLLFCPRSLVLPLLFLFLLVLLLALVHESLGFVPPSGRPIEMLCHRVIVLRAIDEAVVIEIRVFILLSPVRRCTPWSRRHASLREMALVPVGGEPMLACSNSSVLCTSMGCA